MNGQHKNHSESPSEAMEHALMLLETLQLEENSSETEGLRRELLRIYRYLRRYADADALRQGKRKPQEELISVSGLLHGILQEAQYEGILRGFSLQEDVDTALFISADSEFLRRILWNLLQNAITAAGNNGEIFLQSRALGEKCRITVLDNGAGFGECDPQELFRNASEISGFGVIRTLLNLYRTELTFEREGEYTAVSFVLPRVTELPELHAPEGKLGYLQGLSDAEIELSALE